MSDPKAPVPDELRAELRNLGATDREADSVVEELAGLSAMAAVRPEPSAELAALLGETPGVAGPWSVLRPCFGARTRAHARRSGAVGGALVLAISGVGATGISAAANSLPASLQQRVSEFSHHYLPFHFPAPTVKPGPGPTVQGAGRERQAPPLRPAEPPAAPVTPAAPMVQGSSPEVTAQAGSGQPTVSRGRPETADREARPSRSSAASHSPRRASPETAPAQTTKPRSAPPAAQPPTATPPPATAAEPEPTAVPAGAPEQHGRPIKGFAAGLPSRPSVRPVPGEPWQPVPPLTAPPLTAPPLTAPPPAAPPPAAPPVAPPVAPPTVPPSSPEPGPDLEVDDPEALPPEEPDEPQPGPTEEVTQ